MRIFNFILLVISSFPILGLSQSGVIINIQFENPNNIQITSGNLTVLETNLDIEISSLEGFSFSLDKPGKYSLFFTSDNVTSIVKSPERFKRGENNVNIIIARNDIYQSSVYSYAFSLKESDGLNKDYLEKRLSDGTLNFIVNGINNVPTEEMLAFSEKYGVGFVFDNCVIDPLTFKRSRENNKIIHDFLKESIGMSWKDELPANPFGIN